MKRLTKQLALEFCRDWWDWLADHPSKDKEDYPDRLKYDEMRNNCPCCEYYTNHSNRSGDCIDGPNFCLLISLWPTSCMRGQWKYKINIKDSAFQKWRKAKTARTRKKYARVIADACRTELKKMKKKGK